MVDNQREEFGKIIKQRRFSMSMTLPVLAAKSGVSASHLSRVERGERFPSAHVLGKIAKPLGFTNEELFVLAKYLSPKFPAETEKDIGRLDPYVASVLAQETPRMQRTVLAILTIFKALAQKHQQSK